MGNKRLSLTLLVGMLVEIINKLSPLFILHHVQDKLGLQYFGAAQYQLALIESLQPLVLFGYTHYIIANIGANKHDKGQHRRIFSETLFLKVIHGLILLGFVLSFGINKSAPGHWTAFHSYLLLAILSGIFDSSWYYLLNRQVIRFSLLGGGLRICSLIATFAFVNNEGDGGRFIVISILPNLLVMLASTYSAYRELGFGRIIFPQLAKVLMKALPYAIIYALLIAFERVDILMAERWFTDDLVGSYASSSRIIHSLLMITAFVVQAFYSEIVGSEDESSFRKNIALSIWCMLIIVVPIAFGVGFVETPLLGIIYAHNESAASGVLTILSLGLVANALLTVFGQQVLQFKSKPWSFIAAIAIGLVVAVASAYLLRDHYGLRAIALGILAGKIVASVISLYFAARVIGYVPWSPVLRVLGAGSGMYLALRWLSTDSLIANVLVGGLVFLSLLLALNFAEFKRLYERFHDRLFRRETKG